MEHENKNEDPEIIAISNVCSALKDLDSDARLRVLNYVTSKFNIQKQTTAATTEEQITITSVNQAIPQSDIISDDNLEGVSPAGKKWIARSDISPVKLMKIFSLGIDEIDLVAKSIPGKSKATKMKNVFLLKGIAAYLGNGSPRFTHEQVKETCLHYDAFDSANFSNNLKAIAAEVSGTKDSGYTLTARGISEATSLIKNMGVTE